MRKKGYPDHVGTFCAMVTKRERGKVLMWNVDGVSMADVEAKARNRIDLK